MCLLSYFSWKIINLIWESVNTLILNEPLTILVTGAAGEIGYALVPLIARGAMLGPHQPVIIHMLDTHTSFEALQALQMELLDAAFPLLHGILVTTDAEEACKDVSIAIMLAGFPRKQGMGRKDLMSKNISIYKNHALALQQHAAPDCKVLVVANPANTNALMHLSAASCACDHIHDWILGTPKGSWVSMGVCSDGSHGIPKGLIYSFPVTCKNGEWSIVKGLKIDESSREKMDASAQELIEEESLAYLCL